MTTDTTVKSGDKAIISASAPARTLSLKDKSVNLSKDLSGLKGHVVVKLSLSDTSAGQLKILGEHPSLNITIDPLTGEIIVAGQVTEVLKALMEASFALNPQYAQSFNIQVNVINDFKTFQVKHGMLYDTDRESFTQLAPNKVGSSHSQPALYHEEIGTATPPELITQLESLSQLLDFFHRAQVNDAEGEVASVDFSPLPTQPLSVSFTPPSGPTLPAPALDPVVPPAPPFPPAQHPVFTPPVTIPDNLNPLLVDVTTSFTQNENAGATVVDNTVTVTDTDSADFNGGTITVAISGGSADDQLSLASNTLAAGAVRLSGTDVQYSPTGAAWVTIGALTSNGANGSNLVVTLNADSTPAIVQAVIERITYYNSSEDPAATRTATITVSDGDGGISAAQNITISVTPINDAPVNTVPGAQATVENVAMTVSGISVSDVDNSTVTVTLSVSRGTLTVNNAVTGGLTAGGITNNNTANVTLSGTKTAINATLAHASGLTYTPTAAYVGSDTLTVLTNDGGLSDTDTIAITVNSSSTAPVLTGFTTAVTYAENTVNAAIQIIDNSVSLTDSNNTNFNGGNVTVALTSGTVDDQLRVNHQGMAAGQIGTTGGNIYYGGVLIGTLSSDGADGSNLVVELNASSTIASVQKLIENLAYGNGSNDPASTRTITVTVDDGIGGVSTAINTTITVTPQADTLTLTSGTDTFITGAENDTIQGDAANLDINTDQIAGGGGTDLLSITAGTLTLDTATFTDLTGVEQISVTSNAVHSITIGNAYFSTSGFSGNNLTISTNATSTIGVELDASGVSTATKTLTLSSGNGDDTISGGAGSDSIRAYGGDDSIGAGNGNDTISFNGSEIDTSDTIGGGTGSADRLVILSGGSSINTALHTSLTGIEYFDLNSNNTHTLSLNNTYFTGITGSAVYVSTTATTAAITVDGSPITNTAYIVNATGGGGNDTLTGGYANDSLVGSDGNDRIVGGRNGDTLTGGNGADIFAYLSLTGSPIANQDTITDFVSGTDFLDFTGMGLNYIHNNAFTGSANQLRWDVSGSDVHVEVDSDGNSATDFRIVLSNVAGLTSADFIGTNIISQTFVLTFGNDNFAGGISTDQFQGASGNLGTSDTIRGGAGSDVLQITSGALTLNTTTYSNLWGVEQIQLNSDAAHNLTIGNAYFSTTGFVGNTLSVTTSASAANITVNASGVSTATNNVNVIGGDGNDTLTGGAGNDTIDGGDGNDIITGNAGDDSLMGGNGNDRFDYTIANLSTADTILGGAGNDTFRITAGTFVSTLGVTLPNLMGVETVSLASSAAHEITIDETYYTSVGFSGTTVSLTTSSTVGVKYDASGIANTTLRMAGTGGNGNDTMLGGAGNDSFTGGAGNDSMIGADGNDRFTTTAANLSTSDTISGGNGTGDQVYITGGALNANFDTYTNMSGIETIHFDNNAAHSLTLGDTFFARGLSGGRFTVTSDSTTGITIDASGLTAGNVVTLNGNTGADRFSGGAGNDTFNVSTGNDSVHAGAGNDTIGFSSGSYFNASDTISGGAGSDRISITGGSSAFTLDTTTNANISGVETFNISRSGAHRVTLNDAYFGTSGFDGNVVTITTTSTTAVQYDARLVTNAANKVSFTGYSSNDTIYGGAGNDTLNPSSGTDYTDAGDGDDTIIGSGTGTAIVDTIYGGAGIDTLQNTSSTMAFNTGTYVNFYGIERFTLTNNANHVLTFTDGYFGTIGFVGSTVTLVSTQTANSVTLNGSAIANAANTFHATGSATTDNFTGGAGNDTLIGNGGNDNLKGSGGADSITGDDGNDSLTGGDGVDTLTGGNGVDYYYYNLDTESGIGSGNRDIITDFATGDKINLSAYTGTFTFRAGGAGEANFTGTAKQVAYEQVGGTMTIVYVDSNGDGVTNYHIELTGLYTLAATDFTL